MYDFESDYWDITGATVAASFDGWAYKPSNNKFVKPDNTITSRGSTVLVFAMPEHSPIGYESGVYPAGEDLKYAGKIRIYTNSINTTPPVAIPGQTYGQYSCTIPTAEEWNNMTTEEKDAFKNTYFELPSPTALTKLGVSIGTYFVVKFYIFVVARGGDYPTDANYPYYVIWGDSVSAEQLYYDPNSGAITYRDRDIILAEVFKPEAEGVFKALVIQTTQVEKTRYWTGYSGNTASYSDQSNLEPEGPSSGVLYDLRRYDWSIDGVTNHGYPYKNDMSNFNYDLITRPYPSFLWIMGDDINHGYPNICDMPNKTMGSFNNTGIEDVEIGRNVSKIGEYAFEKTELTEVRVPQNCEYYSTSFPKDCNIIVG